MDPIFIQHYNKDLKPYADDLRNKGTKAEAALWKYVLKAKQMKGYTFNRQRPVLNYIVDFMCKPLKLIIEVDGNTHDGKDEKNKDEIRDAELIKLGYVILRFTNDDVLFNIESVRKDIELTIEKSIQK